MKNLIKTIILGILIMGLAVWGGLWLSQDLAKEKDKKLFYEQEAQRMRNEQKRPEIKLDWSNVPKDTPAKG